jgi:hypothetical protein
MTSTRAETEFAVRVRVNSWAGHFEGSPYPCNVIEPPLMEPFIDDFVKDVLMVRDNEFVSPVG